MTESLAQLQILNDGGVAVVQPKTDAAHDTGQAISADEGHPAESKQTSDNAAHTADFLDRAGRWPELPRAAASTEAFEPRGP